MRAAVVAARQQQPALVIVAVPVGAPSTCALLAHEADDVVCVRRPDPFVAVGLWYRDFTPTSDNEVRSLLGEDS
jgi:predicted phosphoribosyltransferase